MAKIANVFGRLEAFSLSIFIYVIGYIQQAGSKNVQTFAAAQIFYSSGSTGLQILQQIFIADTSDLLNRLITVWVGSPIAQSLLSKDLNNWRWGYGVWAIVLPVAFLPLAIALALNMRKAKKLHVLPPGPWKGQTVFGVLKTIWYELDLFGLLLLSAAIALTLAARAKTGWRNHSMIAMLVIGAVSLVAFGFWESSKKLAPKAFMPARLFKSRTVLAGYAIAFFYFGKQSRSPPSRWVWTHLFSSCFLHLRSTLLLLLPASRTRYFDHRSRSHNPDILFRLNSNVHRYRFRHQVHPPLQILHHLRCQYLPHWRRHHDPLPCPRLVHSTACGLSNRRRHWRWFSQRSYAAGCPGQCVPRRRRRRHSHLPHHPRDWRRSG